MIVVLVVRSSSDCTSEGKTSIALYRLKFLVTKIVINFIMNNIIVIQIGPEEKALPLIMNAGLNTLF